jgi:hypothetical protein
MLEPLLRRWGAGDRECHPAQLAEPLVMVVLLREK